MWRYTYTHTYKYTILEDTNMKNTQKYRRKRDKKVKVIHIHTESQTVKWFLYGKILEVLEIETADFQGKVSLI